MKDKRYIYKNHRGGWSICDRATAEVGNFATDLHAIEVAARDCDHVAMLDFDTAIELSRHYRELATAHFQAGRETAAFDYHGWMMWMEIAAAGLVPADALARMQREANEAAAHWRKKIPALVSA
jgi:hypothetical protein